MRCPPGELHPELVPFAGRCGGLCELLQHLTIQSAGSRDKGVALCGLPGFLPHLPFLFRGRDATGAAAFARSAACSWLRLSLCGTGILSALMLVEGVIDAEGPQVFGGAGFGVLAAGVPDQAQFFPPGLHRQAQLLGRSGKVKGLVQPLGHQQAVKRDQRFQLPDAVPVDQPQGGRFFLPLGLLHGLDLLVNGLRHLLALGLHGLDALAKGFQWSV